MRRHGCCHEFVIDLHTGSYARGYDYGIMIGYVVVASITSAMSRVGRAMEARKHQTQQLSGFAPDKSLSSNPTAHHSQHLQQTTALPITLLHIFVPFF